MYLLLSIASDTRYRRLILDAKKGCSYPILRRYIKEMRFFCKKSKPSQGDREKLLEILNRCSTLVKASKDSMWSCMDVHEINNALNNSIDALKRGKKIRSKDMSFLFLPTGPLQDTAIDNGWGEEFLALAERFDVMIKKWE